MLGFRPLVSCCLRYYHFRETVHFSNSLLERFLGDNTLPGFVAYNVYPPLVDL